jgi:hypothetical protein
MKPRQAAVVVDDLCLETGAARGGTILIGVHNMIIALSLKLSSPTCML